MVGGEALRLLGRVHCRFRPPDAVREESRSPGFNPPDQPENDRPEEHHEGTLPEPPESRQTLDPVHHESGGAEQHDRDLESQLRGAVNLRLENVSASDALQALLDNSKLTVVRRGTANLLGITRR